MQMQWDRHRQKANLYLGWFERPELQSLQDGEEAETHNKTEVNIIIDNETDEEVKWKLNTGH